MTIEIIKADERHAAQLGDLWMEFMRYTRDVEPVFAPRDEMIPIFIRDYLRPAMEAQNSLVLAAADGGKVVGYSYSLINEVSSLQDRPNYGCIHDMFITPAYRRKGIGEDMLREIKKWFHSKDIYRIELDVLAGNRIASSFWKKQGFKDFQRTVFLDI